MTCKNYVLLMKNSADIISHIIFEFRMKSNFPIAPDQYSTCVNNKLACTNCM